MHITRRLLPAFAALSLLGVAVAATQWSMQPSRSTLTFVATQAGAKFEGVFERFQADIRFDPQDLSGSRFDVQIETASVSSKDAERDGLLRGPDLFATAQHPQARYTAEKFSARGGNKFAATGTLSLRGVSKSVPIEFTFEQRNGSAWLKGAAQLRRLDFGVGQGDWRDTQTVADEVEVRFALLLQQ